MCDRRLRITSRGHIKRALMETDALAIDCYVSGRTIGSRHEVMPRSRVLHVAQDSSIERLRNQRHRRERLAVQLWRVDEQRKLPAGTGSEDRGSEVRSKLLGNVTGVRADAILRVNTAES